MELNPNHETTQAMRGQWHKLLALVLAKLGADRVVITPADLAAFVADPGGGVAVQELDDGLHVWLVDGAEAQRLARVNGGRPT